ncbi:MAG: SDR family oxidoreductase [Chitinophagaceae bacterium]
MYNQRYHEGNIGDHRFLVTGGAGFIGASIVEYLLQHNAGMVRVLDDFCTGSMDNIKDYLHHPCFELIAGDIRNLDTCKRAVKGMSYVSHQAALGSVPRSINDPIATNEINSGGFLNMLIAARDAGIKKLVYASSSSVYGDHTGTPQAEDIIGKPLSPYAVSKYTNELYAENFSRVYRFHTIGLRYFNVFGPRQNPAGAYAAVIPLFIQAALNNEVAFIDGDGDQSRDFTFIENVVQANIKAMLVNTIARHEVMNIACGQQTTLNQLWKVVCKIVGINLSAHYREERQGDVKHSLASIQKAYSNLGYQPEVSLQHGLKLTVDWYKAAFKAKL